MGVPGAVQRSGGIGERGVWGQEAPGGVGGCCPQKTTQGASQHQAKNQNHRTLVLPGPGSIKAICFLTWRETVRGRQQ